MPGKELKDSQKPQPEQTDTSRTELLQAIKINDEKAVERLITQVDVSEEIEDKQTPIQLAAKLGHWNCVEAIAKNAETDPKDNARYGYALYEAVKKDRIDIVMLLLARGASKRYRTLTGGCLHKAAKNGNAEMVSFLLPFFDVDVSQKNEANLIPIEVAWESGHWNCVRTIAQFKKADENNKVIYGKMLFYAVQDNHLNTARTLLNAGASLRCASTHGNGLLHMAVRNGNKDMIALLLSFGASRRVTNIDGLTPEGLARSLDHTATDAYADGVNIYTKAEHLKLTFFLMVVVQAKRQRGSFFYKLPNAIIDLFLLRFLSRETDPREYTVELAINRINNTLSSLSKPEEKKESTLQESIEAATHLPPPSTTFQSTDLTCADLRYSNFNGVTFSHCNLYNANLSESKFRFAKFINECDLTGAILAKGQFPYADFSDATLERCNAKEADFTFANFSRANLSDVIFTEADLRSANFQDANMKGALLNNAHFDLNQFSKEQVLSFHYEDPHAKEYIYAIYKYMEKYGHEYDKHKDGFKHAKDLIYSFINHHPYDQNGQNLLLKGFLDDQVLRFTSKLHEGLSAVHKKIKKGIPAPVTDDASSEFKSGARNKY